MNSFADESISENVPCGAGTTVQCICSAATDVYSVFSISISYSELCNQCQDTVHVIS